MAGSGQGPVSDRAETEEQRAAAREDREVVSRPHRLLIASSESNSSSCFGEVAHRLGDCLEQRARLRERPVGSRVDELQAWVGAAELDRVTIERHERGAAVQLRLCCDCVEERLDVGGTLRVEDDVVAPEEPSERLVELGDPGRCGEGLSRVL